MVDCAEGTTRQFANQPWSFGRTNPRPTQVRKMFITHMHGKHLQSNRLIAFHPTCSSPADHVMGIIPFLRNVLFPPSADPQMSPPSVEKAVSYQRTTFSLWNVNRPSQPSIEIYGPAGIRNFVRSTLKMTLTRTADNYVVHELLTREDQPTLCNPPEVLHCNEIPGRDIYCSDQDGFWRDITLEKGSHCDVAVDAGPILHRGMFSKYILCNVYAINPLIQIHAWAMYFGNAHHYRVNWFSLEIPMTRHPLYHYVSIHLPHCWCMSQQKPIFQKPSTLNPNALTRR